MPAATVHVIPVPVLVGVCVKSIEVLATATVMDVAVIAFEAIDTTASLRLGNESSDRHYLPPLIGAAVS